MTTSESGGKGWTVANMPEQTGRRVLITGANSGIGYYAALELARKGAHVLLACRDAGRGEAALATLRSAVPAAAAEVVRLDLASLGSVRAVAAAELERGLPLDLLINNAGVMAPKKRQETQDGMELQFGTNVVGHFALTALLMPALERAASAGREQARVVTLASIAHKTGKLNFDDLQSKRSYDPMGAYRQSKLADLMFAFDLDRRLRAAGSRVMSVAAHPGVANTNLFQVGEFHAVERLMRRWAATVIGALLNSEAEGALPTLYAATAEGVKGGGYYGPQGWRESRGGDVGVAKVEPQARDQEAAERLWNECERLAGVPFLSAVQMR